MTLDAALDYKMKWKIESDEIEIILSAKTTGYLAIGFGGGRSMVGSKAVLGWVKVACLSVLLL